MPIRTRILLLRRLPDAGYPLLALCVALLGFQAVVPAVTALATAGTVEALHLHPDQRINGTHRERLATLVLASPTIAAQEQPQVQDLIRATGANPKTWVERTPADGALGQLFTLSRYVGITASGIVVARYSWWLVVLLVVPALAVCHRRGGAIGSTELRQRNDQRGVIPLRGLAPRVGCPSPWSHPQW